MDRIYQQEEADRIELRRQAGFVIPTWSKDMPISEYQGALSLELFGDDGLQDYLSNGGCHGYIGASERTFEIDMELERACRDRKMSVREIAWFLSHSAGRHFADQLRVPADVEEYLEQYLPTDCPSK